MEEAYLKAKELVTKKYGRDYKYFALVTLGLCALLYKYKEHYDDVADLFNRMDIYLDNDSVLNIIKKNKIEAVDYDDDEDEKFNNDNIASDALSYEGHSCRIIDGKACLVTSNPTIIMDIRANKTVVLNNFIHEFNHLVKNIVDGCHLLDDKLGIEIRSGINYYIWSYDIEEDCVSEAICFCALDEVINVFQTTEMMESLLMLDGIIPDEDVAKHYNELDEELMHDDVGYERVTKEVKPLWENPEFHDLIDDNIYDGNLFAIIEGFDNIMGESSFDRFASYVNAYNDEINNGIKSKKNVTPREKIKNVVKKFNNLTNYVYKK